MLCVGLSLLLIARLIRQHDTHIRKARYFLSLFGLKLGRMADASAFFDNPAAVDGGFSDGGFSGEGDNAIDGGDDSGHFPSTPVEQLHGDLGVLKVGVEEGDAAEDLPLIDNSSSDTDDDTEDCSEVVLDGRKAAIENSKSEAEIAKLKKEAQMEINDMNNMIIDNNNNNERSEVITRFQRTKFETNVHTTILCALFTL